MEFCVSSVMKFISLLLLIFVQSGSCLECYACVRQDGNKDKCIKTSKQCEESQDICMSSIEWGLPRYWVPYGDRVHYVSKDCSKTSQCEQAKKDSMPQCKRDWFDDWKCVECCSGDLCNYYVTLTATIHPLNSVLCVISALTTIVVRRMII